MARNSTWTVRDFSQCEQTARTAWEALANDQDRVGHAMRTIAAARELDEAAVLQAIVLGIMTLELHGRSGILTTADARRLKDDTWLLLQANGVTPSSSRLSFLYGRILRAESAALLRKGLALPAAARQEVATLLTYRGTEAESAAGLLGTAQMQLRLGHASLAIASINTALALVPAAPWADAARVFRAKALRLSGGLSEAEAARATIVDVALPEAVWEVIAPELADSAKVAAAAARIFRGREIPLAHLLMAKLWVCAVGSRAARQSLPKTASLRRRTLVSGSDDAGTKALLAATQTFDEGFDDAFPLHSRLNAISDLCGALIDLPDVESHLLVLAAATRHARQYAQNELANLYLAEYRALCSRLSDGQHRDLLKVGHAMEAAALDRTLTGVARARKLASAVGEAALISVSSRVRRRMAGGEERERIARQELFNLGESMVRHLGVLKGGMMKIGQFLSTVDGLPVEIRGMLSLLRQSADPTSWAAVRKELEKAYGDPDQVFDSFETVPFAVGSIAQIHRAVLKESGRTVAVKVQHPGIRDSIGSDLGILKFLRPFLSRLAPAMDIGALTAELAARLEEETDFVREAAVQESFRKAFLGDESVVIPEVHARWSGERILVMDLIDGRRYQDFVQEADAAAKNHAGVIIARAFTRALLERGMFNCDPHPGNFLLLPDGKVAFLDFGCSREWDLVFVRKMLLAPFECLLADDFARFTAVVKEIGYDRASGRFDFDAHWRLCQAYYEPLLKPGRRPFDKAYLDRVSALHVESPNMKTASPPPEGLMLLRITFGLMNILVELGAEADWHAMAAEAMSRQSARPISQPA